MFILSYCDPVKERGLNLVQGPGNDLCAITALMASGAQLVLFTTGRGTPFGVPAPVIKIASNTPMAERKKCWIDFNAGVAADGVRSLDECAQDLLDLVCEVASGKKTRSEEQGYREIAIFKDGIML